MNFDQTIKNISSTLNKKDKLPNTKSNINIIEECYQNYLKSNDTKFLEKYIRILIDNSFPNKKELFLKKIENNKTVLDYIIEKDIFLDYDTSFFLANDIELLTIFLKQKRMNILSYSHEKMFYKKIEDITLIEYLIKNNLLTSYWIKKINSNLLIELLFKYNKGEYLKYANEKILFKKLKSDKLVIEYLIKNNYATKETIIKINNPFIYEVLLKNNKQELLKYLSNEVLICKYKGKPILECLLENNIIPEINLIYEEKLVKLLIKNNKLKLLKNTSSYILRKRIPKTITTIFEYLLLKGIVCNEAIEKIKLKLSGSDEFLDIISKYNKFDLLENFLEEELLTHTYKNETLFEILIRNGITPKKINCYEKEEAVEILLKYNKYDELQKTSELLLHKVLPNGKCLYQELLDRGFDIKLPYLEDSVIVSELVSRNKEYVYSMLPVNMQLKKIDENKTMLESILEKNKENPNIDLSNLMTFTDNLYRKAQLYIIYAKYDKQKYLKKLKKEDLLEIKKDKKLIDILLELDEELTINKIIEDDVKEELDIAMLLKLQGHSQEKVKFDSITIKLEREYLTNLRFEYEALTLDNENEELLGELYNVMNDKKSNPYLIYSLVASYRNLLSQGNKYSREIEHLINIKNKHSNFLYKYVEDGAYFSPLGHFVGMEDANIDTLNHETGHALFNYLTDKEVPEEYKELIEKLRNDEDMLKRTETFSIRLQQIKEEVEEEVEREYMSKYDKSITEEKKQEIQDFLDEEIYIQKLKYLKLGYDEELLDTIFSKMYTLDEYLKQDRRIKKHNMIDLILRTRFAPLLCTSDYIDGIYKGKYKADELKSKEGKLIKGSYGHGIEYYSRGIERIFGEMIANYSEIVKSKNPSNGIRILREYVGNELVDFIKKYYDKNILYSKKYADELLLKR